MAKKAMSVPVADLLDQTLAELIPKIQTLDVHRRRDISIKDVPAGKQVMSLDRESQVEVVRGAVERLKEWDAKHKALAARTKPGVLSDKQVKEWNSITDPIWVWTQFLRDLLRRELPLDEKVLIDLVKRPAESNFSISNWFHPLTGLTTAVENFAKGHEINKPLRSTVEKFVEQLQESPYKDHCRKLADRLQALLGSGATINLEPGESWSDAALADLQKMKAKPAQAWKNLLNHCQSGGRGKISAEWREKCEALIKAVGFDSLKKTVLVWFPLVDRPRTVAFKRKNHWEPDFTNLILPPHVEMLRGLAWACALREDSTLARAIAKLAQSAYRKIPGKGPRLVSLGNACVTALGLMPGRAPIGQLALLKVKVKFGTAQKEIEKAFNAAAEREGLPRDEVEELAVPSYGLEEVGRLQTELGEYLAELLVDGASAALHWTKEGRPIKSVPATVKSEHAEEYKDLQASLKDINAMLPAQRERIDSLFLAQKTWPLDVWRERYLDHPLVGTIARRLIWCFTTKGKPVDGLWHDGDVRDVYGKPLALKESTSVSLWHPIGRPSDEVLAWRESLERREIVQPFKQAHREVYLLTDAERRTETYSNRFAAHILKQHQFNALCSARGWKNQLRLMVDSSYAAPFRNLKQWNLRAEYWVEGAGSEYGTDTNESGVYQYLATDQVRFYTHGANQLHAHASGGGYGRWNQGPDEPLRLEEIPPLVFSEIMRDVDLFVGVASVGNDPNWADGGPNGRYVDYWQKYSFGELSATARTRHDLLDRLLPRLKIAQKCSLTDRFLLVQGQLRGYKIHLGSGNILMTPNDQYLCIVPKQTTAGHDRVFLPFEGDGMMSVILSKAFLLADDVKITDTTITNQIKR